MSQFLSFIHVAGIHAVSARACCYYQTVKDRKGHGRSANWPGL